MSCRQKVELKVLGTKPDVLAITTQKQHTVTRLFQIKLGLTLFVVR